MPVSFAYRLSLIAAACSALAACSTFNNATGRIGSLVTPYKVEVVQGNFVAKEQKEALQPGMPRTQVRDILGSPLVTSAFHADRWDYAFSIRRQGQEPQLRKLTVFFKGDEMLKVESDELPTEKDFVASLSEGRKLGKVPLLEVPPEVLREFGIKAGEQNAALVGTNTALNAPVSVASASYPPLETPGAVTSAWDASTQRAVAASASARPPAAAQAPVLAAQAPLLTIAPSPTSTPPPAPAATSSPVATAPASAAPASAQAAVAPRIAPAPTPASSINVAPAIVATAPQAAVAQVAPAAGIAPATPTPARPIAALPAPAQQAASATLPPPQPAPSASTLANADPDITTFLNRWTSDWQARNAVAYFSHYLPEFKGTSETRAEWEALRRTRIEGRTRISLAVLDVRVRMVSPTEARLVFRQNYDSDTFIEVGTKAMFLVKRDGRWLVEREFFTPSN